MISLPRVFLSLFLYGAYIFAIIAIAEPRQNTALYLILLALGSVVFLAGMFSGFFIVPGKYRRIKAHGVEAEATILAVSDTGVTMNKNPYVKPASARGTDRYARVRNRSESHGLARVNSAPRRRRAREVRSG